MIYRREVEQEIKQKRSPHDALPSQFIKLLSVDEIDAEGNKCRTANQTETQFIP